MENQIVVCPACSSPVDANNKFCTQCGYSFEKNEAAKALLDTNPGLKTLNERYAKKKRAIKVWASILGLSLGAIYMWLEHGWFEHTLLVLSTAALAIPIAVVMLIIDNIASSTIKKKIQSELDSQVGPCHLDF
jgi:uncharacterized membrane protein